MPYETDLETAATPCRVPVKRAVVLVFGILLLTSLTDWARSQSPVEQKSRPEIRLGERLFRDDRFSTPQGDLPASCSHCHLYDEDPQGRRAYADFFNRSWVSYRLQDPRRLELRNSPTIYDAGEMPRLHFDGEFTSLEELVKGTLAGRPMGWLPGERDRAFAQVQAVLLGDKGEGRGAEGSYRDQFKQAYGVDLEKLGRSEAVDLVARAISDFVRTLKTEKNSPYDSFIRVNGLEAGPAAEESGQAFGKRLLLKVSALEAQGKLRLPDNFGADAVRGLKIFLRTEGDGATGNCVSCHVPPLFTDFSFHNLGVSQREYDQIHGAGKFAALPIPSAAAATRPSAQFRETPAKGRPGEADLGHWNFVDLKNSPLRRAGESDDQFLGRMIATFKTPTLRNLAYTHPYFHTGALSSLEEVLDELILLSDMARAGQVRQADEELGKIKITQADVAPLAAFLNTLNGALR